MRFRLADQFGKIHDAADYRGHAFYVVGAGRKGRVVATTWATTLASLLTGNGLPVARLYPLHDRLEWWTSGVTSFDSRLTRAGNPGRQRRRCRAGVLSGQ